MRKLLLVLALAFGGLLMAGCTAQPNIGVQVGPAATQTKVLVGYRAATIGSGSLTLDSVSSDGSYTITVGTTCTFVDAVGGTQSVDFSGTFSVDNVPTDYQLQLTKGIVPSRASYAVCSDYSGTTSNGQPVTLQY